MTAFNTHSAESSPGATVSAGGGAAPLIRLDSVAKVFSAADQETKALADISLSIHRGEFVAISGPSGCGKSTLLSIIGLLDSATEGQYLFDGAPVESLSLKSRAWFRNRKIGFIFQNFNLIGDLTVVENVELPVCYRKTPADERRRWSAEALDRVGMSHRAKYYPSQLSGGQQQRVAVARALVGRPEILLADEPTGNLDSKNGHAVMDLLDSVHAAGATVCIVTHDPRYAVYARRRIELLDGRLVDSSTVCDGA